MLYRKIKKKIEYFLKSIDNKVLIIEGAHQIGKTFIIREVAKEMYPNFIEINMLEDKLSNRNFQNVRTTDDFYIRLSGISGNKMHNKNDTLIFIDEIQEYPELITLLKFLNEDNKYKFIASGSLLGITLSEITSIPIGSIEIMQMYPLDFEEFIIANGIGNDYISFIKEKFLHNESLEENDYNKMMDLFKKYLLIGGMPDAVNNYIENKNIQTIRSIQKTIINLYKADCSKYDQRRRLKIKRLYELIPSNMENKKKRVTFNDIENKKGKRKSDYDLEFEYLISAGIAIPVLSISEPRFPLLQSTTKSLIKLYMNDVGLLSCLLYDNNIKPIFDHIESINLGSIYETVVATELKAHDKALYYFDNKKLGEVDFLIDDFENLSIIPIEIKSGKNYYVHNAINNLISIKNYNIKNGIVLSNSNKTVIKNDVSYYPIFNIMFL